MLTKRTNTNRKSGYAPKHSDAALLAYCTDARVCSSIAEALEMSPDCVRNRLMKLQLEGKVLRSETVDSTGRTCWGWTRT